MANASRQTLEITISYIFEHNISWPNRYRFLLNYYCISLQWNLRWMFPFSYYGAEKAYMEAKNWSMENTVGKSIKNCRNFVDFTKITFLKRGKAKLGKTALELLLLLLHGFHRHPVRKSILLSSIFWKEKKQGKNQGRGKLNRAEKRKVIPLSFSC